MGGVVRRLFADHRHRQSIEDAAEFAVLQAQADIPRVYFAAQGLTRFHRRVRHTDAHLGGRQLQAQQLILRIVGADLTFNDHPGVITHRHRQVKTCEGFANRAAGQRFAFAE
ncbi:hypothetical protein D3C78_1626970 [compost metagenome]